MPVDFRVVYRVPWLSVGISIVVFEVSWWLETAVTPPAPPEIDNEFCSVFVYVCDTLEICWRSHWLRTIWSLSVRLLRIWCKGWSVRMVG